LHRLRRCREDSYAHAQVGLSIILGGIVLYAE
jgi:hypothetical protein